MASCGSPGRRRSDSDCPGDLQGSVAESPRKKQWPRLIVCPPVPPSIRLREALRVETCDSAAISRGWVYENPRGSLTYRSDRKATRWPSGSTLQRPLSSNDLGNVGGRAMGRNSTKKPAGADKGDTGVIKETLSIKDDIVKAVLKRMIDAAQKKHIEGGGSQLHIVPRMKTNVGKLKVVNIGSMCSGSNITTVMIKKLFEVLKSGKVRDTFACEADQSKRGWLKFVGDSMGDPECHIFDNIMNMGRRHATCVVHDRPECSVPSNLRNMEDAPLISTTGFSCKNFSKLFAGTAGMSRSEMLDEILKQGKGSTGATCKGMLAYLSNHSPPFHIWENVKEILEMANAENLEWLIAALAKCKYACAVSKYTSSDYQVPQARTRAYGVCVRWGMGLERSEAQALAKRIIKDSKLFASAGT
eukprot:7865968-Pyramimonas_sp.AAC.1